jgi:hypothetical protein
MNKYVAGGIAIGAIVLFFGVKKFAPWAPVDNKVVEVAIDKALEKETGLEKVAVEDGLEGAEEIVKEVIEKKA